MTTKTDVLICIGFLFIFDKTKTIMTTSKTVYSKRFTLGWRDILKGLIMAIITPALVVAQQSLDKGDFTFNWKYVAMASMAGGVAYLIKNLFEPSKSITTYRTRK